MDHNGDMYFTDDKDVVGEYEYEPEDFLEFLFVYNDEYIEKGSMSLIEDLDSLEELVEGYADDFAKWLDKEREE